MTKEKQLLEILESISGNGSFTSLGMEKFVHPGLQIKGVGDVGFPVSPVTARKMIKVARRAPFGKGSQTIVDTSVRSGWEIDANQISFKNEDWLQLLDSILRKVKDGLGLKGYKIQASLYKLLIYEKGDFFVMHKDSEKEKNMFGTLVVSLPSKHTGGELIVSFDGREERIHFAEAGNYKIPFASFFADCDHEVKPVDSGYRIVLTYNLIQNEPSKEIGSSSFSTQVVETVPVLKSMESSFTNEPKAILLDHQYTPANFSKDSLKGSDLLRAEALLEAAEQAGYVAKLILVTHYRSGVLEGDFYYDCETSEAPGSMGDIIEEYTTIDYWIDDEMPDLGQIMIAPKNILTTFEIGEGEPIQQEEEGYTGNAGMTIDYWYHYGAVILWPKNKQGEILDNVDVSVKLNWLDFYLRHWKNVELQSPDSARQLIVGLVDEDERSRDDTDFSIVASVLAKMKDEAFLKKQAHLLLVKKFEKIDVTDWVVLFRTYNPKVFNPIFAQAVTMSHVYIINHFLEILRELFVLKSPKVKAFVLSQIQHIPDYFQEVKLSNLYGSYYYDRSPKETISAVVENIILVSKFWEKNAMGPSESLLDDLAEILTKTLSREYVNKIIAPIVTSKKCTDLTLAKRLKEVARMDLVERTAVKPMPLPNWKRKVPKSRMYSKVWKILRPFLESPTQQIFDYQIKQSYRSEMENAIRSVTIDLDRKTIKNRSPYTLRLTKTNAAFELKLKKWKEDMKVLKSLS